ncbi:hypothetical protein ACR77J_07240 [Tissierella praeacuta]|uniref:hypothetical protein n=1 Tax=Tissierella praeacuta TaxID=43131 RepID=UPI003DA65E42
MITNKTKMEIAYLAKQKGANKSQIARSFNISRTNIKYYQTYFSSKYESNEQKQHQILLGSKLGDGYFQETRNNINPYKYRETHSINEIEYLKWKYLMMDEMTEGMCLTAKNNGKAYELSTNARSSNFIEKYYNKSADEVINEIDINGLLVWILDDGWYSDHSKTGNILIGSRILTTEQKKQIMSKFKSYGIQSTLVGQKEDITISSQDNFILLAHLHKLMFTLDIDVIDKKFGAIIKQI